MSTAQAGFEPDVCRATARKQWETAGGAWYRRGGVLSGLGQGEMPGAAGTQ